MKRIILALLLLASSALGQGTGIQPAPIVTGSGANPSIVTSGTWTANSAENTLTFTSGTTVITLSGSGTVSPGGGGVTSTSVSGLTVSGTLLSGTVTTISGTIPTSQVSGLATVATTGSFASLLGTPSIVNSLGGVSGTIALGTNLSITSGTLNAASSGSQTPWVQNINGAGYVLSNFSFSSGTANMSNVFTGTTASVQEINVVCQWAPTSVISSGFSNYGIFSSAQYTGTNGTTNGSPIGVYGEGINDGSAGISLAIGGQFRAGNGVNFVSGTTAAAYGIDIAVPDTSGTSQPITLAVGLQIEQQSKTGVTTAYAIRTNNNDPSILGPVIIGNTALGIGVDKLSITDTPSAASTNLQSGFVNTTWTPTGTSSNASVWALAAQLNVMGAALINGGGVQSAMAATGYGSFSGTAASISAIYGKGGFTGSGSLQNGYTIYLDSPYTSSGHPIGNYSGIYIASQSGANITNSYAINQVGTGDQNKFAGSIIGTSGTNTLNNQTLTGTGSILTQSLGDGRYAAIGTAFTETGTGSAVINFGTITVGVSASGTIPIVGTGAIKDSDVCIEGLPSNTPVGIAYSFIIISSTQVQVNVMGIATSVSVPSGTFRATTGH